MAENDEPLDMSRTCPEPENQVSEQDAMHAIEEGVPPAPETTTTESSAVLSHVDSSAAGWERAARTRRQVCAATCIQTAFRGFAGRKRFAPKPARPEQSTPTPETMELVKLRAELQRHKAAAELRALELRELKERAATMAIGDFQMVDFYRYTMRREHQVCHAYSVAARERRKDAAVSACDDAKCFVALVISGHPNESYNDRFRLLGMHEGWPVWVSERNE